MKLRFLTALILTLALPNAALAQVSSTSASALKYCYGPYALCTISRCKTPPDKSPIPSTVDCGCTVSAGYSVGQACKADSNPRSILSRYSPIRGYQQCPGVIDGKMAVWANCLNAPCAVDPNNTGAATCKCQTETSDSSFVIASDHRDLAACRACTVDSHGHYDCPDGLISSATTGDAQNITVLIQDAIGDIKVFPPPAK
jgi:hypothetical protein